MIDSGGDTQTPNSAGTSTGDGNSSATRTDGGNGQGEQVTEKEKIDEIVSGRIARELKKLDAKIEAARKEERETLLAQLDADDPEEVIERLAKARESESSEAKTKRQMAKLERERDEALQRLSGIEQKQRDATIESAVLKAAADATDAEAVLALLHRGGGLEVDEDGKVTAHGNPIDKAVKQLLNDRPYLARGDQDRGGGGSREPAAPPAAPTEPRTFEERKQVLAQQGVGTLYDWEKPQAQ